MAIQTLRAGVVGLGVGRSHVEGYQQQPGVELAALCDTNEARLREAAGRFNIPRESCYTDFAAMLEGAALDIVSICLPNALHADAAIRAMEAGCHVLCEKPLAPSSVEAREMIKAARLNDRRLMVAYNNRYRADVAWLQRMIAAGQLGKVYHVDTWWRRETGIPGRGWFVNRQVAGGGALLDLGVHALDLALWLLDYPVAHSVNGDIRMHFGPRGAKVWDGPRWMSEPGTEFNVDDGAVGFIRLEGGINIILHATWAEHRPPQDDLLRLEIQGTEGGAVLNIPNYRREDTLRFYTEIQGEPVTVIPAVRWPAAWGHTALIHDVIESLRHNTPPPVTAEQGLASVRILEAIYHSAKTGREVVFEPIHDTMV